MVQQRPLSLAFDLVSPLLAFGEGIVPDAFLRLMRPR